MEQLLSTVSFSRYGGYLLTTLFGLAGVVGLVGVGKLFARRPLPERPVGYLLSATNLLFLLGYLLICWLHYRIYRQLPLVLPDNLLAMLNQQLAATNSQAGYSLPLLDPLAPPRYMIPLWIENEKYYFWFMCYGFMAQFAHRKAVNPRLQGLLLIFLAVQVGILFFAADPFAQPLPKFFSEVGPWFSGQIPPMQQMGLFMRLYPKMIFYYNASYMWLHPPMLFIAYACITITFLTSAFMLHHREVEIETMGYDHAKLGYLLLTVGMLIGYPWALQAWGPNWWWDPKICSSIMMWSVFSTYLHTRLYANKKGMWYFTSLLGILCFVAMVFTFITSFYFPGEHTFQ